ncbi:MAG: DUF1804 family protein [Magnetococcales bacterium]|nr:DUF1804 family protein [Magnetococcales bacterium]
MQVRQAVQRSYRENGGNLAQAARAHGVSPSAARRWKQRDQGSNRDWDGQQEPLGDSVNWLAESSRESLVGDLLEDYLALHRDAVEAVKREEVMTPLQRVDALSRLSQALDRTLRALGKASPDLSRLAVARWVLGRQAEFVKTRFPDHLSLFVEILEPFSEELLREIGKSQ